MGTVYLAEDTNLKRRVALKFLSPETVHNPDAAARLLREARAASALDHPHIATVYEIGDHAGQPFIAMAHYEGETLAARLARGPHADRRRSPASSRRLADALDAAHTAGIVHRDLKPSNVMLTTDGTSQSPRFRPCEDRHWGDRDAAHRVPAARWARRRTCRPSRRPAKTVDARSDLWSLGVVTYEMLAGRPPFNGTSALAIIHAVLTATPAPIRTLRPDVPPELEDSSTARWCATASGARSRPPKCAILRLRVTRGCRPDNRPLSRGRGRRAGGGSPPRSSRSLVAAGGVAWRVERNAKVRWARARGAAGDHQARRRGQVRRRLPPRAAGAALHPGRSTPRRTAAGDLPPRPSIVTDPPGADVFYRPYGRQRRALAAARKGPIARRGVPRGLLHWKAEMAGRETAEDVGPASSPTRRASTCTLVRCEPGPGRDGADRIGRSAVQVSTFRARTSSRGSPAGLLD